MSGFLRNLYALFGDVGKMIDHFLILTLLLRAIGVVERLAGVLQLQRRKARNVGIALCSTVAAARVFEYRNLGRRAAGGQRAGQNQGRYCVSSSHMKSLYVRSR